MSAPPLGESGGLPNSPSIGIGVDSPATDDTPTKKPGAFSPTGFFGSKFEAAKTALASSPIAVKLDVESTAASAAFADLTSPVRAQVDAALARASVELRTKVASVEAELREKAKKLDQQYDQAKAELTVKFEKEKLQLEQRYADAQTKAEQKYAEAQTKVNQLQADYESKKADLKNKALHELEKVLVDLLDEKVLPAIQSAALDPHMPVFVQNLILDAIEATWPDIKEELFHAWQNLTLDFEPIPAGEPRRCCANPIAAVKASFLYHTFPYDRSLWWQIRTPMWWFWLVVSIFPLYGVQAAYFIFLFLMICSSWDEFQLVRFILQFKGLQFITLGIINCMVGAASYYNCVSVEYAGVGEVGYADASVQHVGRAYIHDCDVAGPAALPGFYTDMILFLIQSTTIWAAMWMLPSTEKKGLRKLTPTSPPRHFEGSKLASTVETKTGRVSGKPVYAGMGGKLRLFIFWDAFLLFLVVAITVLLLFTRPYRVTTSGAFAEFEWLFREDIFWLKTLYGLMAFPFAIFLIPVVSDFLLHTRDTGFNRAGDCVPMEMKKDERLPEAILKRMTPKQKEAYEAKVNAPTFTQRVQVVAARGQAWVSDSPAGAGSVALDIRSTNQIAPGPQ